MGTTVLLTADDLSSLPDSASHELVRGVLQSVSLADASHGSIVARLLAALAQHVYARGLGEVFSEGTGFLLERNPDTVLGPDAAFVAGDRLPPGGLGPAYLDLAPDLAVEVVSKGDRRSDVMAKVTTYLRLGVRSVWVVLPAERAVAIYEAVGAESPQRKMRLVTTVDERGFLATGPDAGATGTPGAIGELLPGFHLAVASLFSAVRR